MDKRVLVIKTETLLCNEAMQKLYDRFVEQVKNGVVVIPPYFEAEIIQCPEDVEVRFETPRMTIPEFLNKEFNVKGETKC